MDRSDLRQFGLYDYDWSPVAIAYSSAMSAKAYVFGFDTSHVYPSNDLSNRYFGFPVRCLVY